MGNRREYDIAFVGLKPGEHEFNYEIGDKFFTGYDEQDFTGVKATVKLTLDKKTGFMLLKFDIGGSLQVSCDRCGNNLPLQLWDEFKLVVKLVDNPDEMNEQEDDPDVYYIGRTESHLHIADWIYEFINLSLPMTRMCSEAEMGGPHCNKAVLEQLKKMQPEEHNANAIWKGLEKFKEKKSK
ncbi:MAG: DUF177 domain-containing protein [Chitinophagaceae bacterium]|nr:DUF177 domain-containing protein [Chitinophagaceae bacterium]